MLYNEEDKYLSWYSDSVANKGLIDIKFFPADTLTIGKEEFYQEANKINDYLDNKSYTPLFKVEF